MTRPPALWLPQSVLAALVAEADRVAPLETGGVMLGYVTGSDEPVVNTVVGPGPEAVHERYRFVPDHDYQLGEIGRLYHESGRKLQYLGDWHTHPGGAPRLSRTDLATLRKIAAEKKARISRPVMLILSPGPEWQPTAWQSRLMADRFRFRHRLETWPLEVHVFDRSQACGTSDDPPGCSTESVF